MARIFSYIASKIVEVKSLTFLKRRNGDLLNLFERANALKNHYFGVLHLQQTFYSYNCHPN